jgi:hypothetical protein
VVGSPDCRHSLLPKSGFTAVGLVDRSIHQLSSRHTIPVRFTLNSAEREIKNWHLLAFLFGEKRIRPSSVTTVALPSALRPGYPHVSLIEDRSIAFFAATSLLSFLRKGTLR